MKLITTDVEAALKEAIDAFLDGKTVKLAEIKNRAVLAEARRKLWVVLRGGKVADK